MEGIQLAAQVTPWLASGRNLFLIIHLLGILCFAYIVARRLVPLLRAMDDAESVIRVIERVRALEERTHRASAQPSR